MRTISFGDDEGRYSLVGIRPCFTTKEYVKKPDIKRVIKSTYKTDGNVLLSKFNNNKVTLAHEIIENDSDIDFYEEGLEIDYLKQIYLSSDNKIINSVSYEEQVYNSDGELVEKRNYEKTEGNIHDENFPIRMSGLSIPISEALRRYVFSHHYQLIHTNGLTFDFLYKIAKRLSNEKCLMYVGGGVEGKDPVVLIKGGKRYQAFLSGNVVFSNYRLCLHFTNIDLEDY
jgi:hypothetical protein